MNINEVTDMIMEKAPLLDLPVKRVIATESAGETTMNYKNGVYTINFDSQKPLPELASTLEFLLSAQVTNFTSEMLAFPSPCVAGTALAICYSYDDYLASKIHRNTFGQESFNRFQSMGLAEFVEATDERILETQDYESALLDTCSLWREQIKCEQMVPDPKVIPSIIKKMIEPLKDCFDLFDTQGVLPPDKYVFINGLAFAMNVYIDIPHSYAYERIIDGEKDGLDYITKFLQTRVPRLLREQVGEIMEKPKLLCSRG